MADVVFDSLPRPRSSVSSVHEAVFREAALNKVKRPARAAERSRSSPHALAAAPELFRAFLYDAAGRIHA